MEIDVLKMYCWSGAPGKHDTTFLQIRWKTVSRNMNFMCAKWSKMLRKIRISLNNLPGVAGWISSTDYATTRRTRCDKRDHSYNNGFTAWHRFWKSCLLLNLYSHTFRPTSFYERALTVVNHTLTFEVELGVRITCGKIWRVIGASGHVSTQFTFSMLYFSIACVAQSTASCCMSSLMSAFLMTALRSVILSVFCCLLLDLEAARD